MAGNRVSELTVDELWESLRDKMQTLIRDELRKALDEMRPEVEPAYRVEAPRLNLPVIDLGPWPEGLTLRREEMYGDDER